MILGFGTVTLAWWETALLPLLGIALGGILGYALSDKETERVEGTLNVDELPAPPEERVDLPPPDIGSPRFGIVSQLWALYKHHVRKRRLARKGYVRWFRVENGTLSGPHYVRPQQSHESPFYEVEHDGGKYFFPDDAMVPDTSTGMWTVIHREGEADPINLRDGNADAIPAKAAKNWSEMEVSSEPPSWLSDLDLDPQTIMYGAIGLTIVLAVLRGGL